MKKLILIYTSIVSYVLFAFPIIIPLPFAGWVPISDRIILASDEKDGGVAPVSPDGKELTGNQWLLVIGIDSYDNLPHLKTSVNDAKAVKDILIKRYLFDEYHTIELYDDEATGRNIVGKLRYLTRRVGQEDSVVIFYSGHGVLDSSTHEGNWIPFDGGINGSSARMANSEISNYLNYDALNAKHVLLIVDSCFTGDFLGSYTGEFPRVTDEVIKHAYNQKSRQVITSETLRPVVGEGIGSNSSVFVHYLLKGLKSNMNPFLLPSDLFTDIKKGLEKSGGQKPGYGILRGRGDQEGGELVFPLNQDELVRAGDLKEQAKTVRKNLRASYQKLSVSQVQSMPYVEIREEQEWGFYGHSTISHQYEEKTIGYDKVVIDHATGLMWHQNGSEMFMKEENIMQWVAGLNEHGYAGYKDWRLPTAEEAVSILESEEKFGGLYVDPVFDNKQTWIWTGDRYGSGCIWVVSTCYGSVFWSDFTKFFSIRPVRSMD